ncbi:hypothetical protein NL108_013511, partial [Boleophthalmus pectinirostris]
CAGVCSYEGRGGLCSIRLSEPLLKLRPRKDLVETLLHEMIHALLFVTQNNRDRDGHGPEFCKHMNRINQASGTKISIYHTFHDEVDVYRQHWWRCDGPCQNRKPYFGYVKRAMNRAPSHLDPWWEDHRRTCGGTYTKVKEPEGYGKKKGSKKDKTSASDKPTSISGKEKTENSKPSTSDLFNKSNSKSSTSVPNLTPSKSTPSKSIHSKYPPVIPTNNSPEKATHSKYFNEANTNRSSTGGQGSKKRSWEDSRSSASIFDYFQKTIEGNSVDSISANSSKPKSATVTTSAPPQTSMGQNTATSSSSSSSAVMVSCPVCLVKVQEAKINEHLDSCLS